MIFKYILIINEIIIFYYNNYIINYNNKYK